MVVLVVTAFEPVVEPALPFGVLALRRHARRRRGRRDVAGAVARRNVGHREFLAVLPLEGHAARRRRRARHLVAVLVLVLARSVADRTQADRVAVLEVDVDVALPLAERARAGLALLLVSVLADFAGRICGIGLRRVGQRAADQCGHGDASEDLLHRVSRWDSVLGRGICLRPGESGQRSTSLRMGLGSRTPRTKRGGQAPGRAPRIARSSGGQLPGGSGMSMPSPARPPDCWPLSPRRLNTAL